MLPQAFQLGTLDRDDRGARVLGDAQADAAEGARVTDCRIACLSERLVDAKHDAAGPAHERGSGWRRPRLPLLPMSRLQAVARPRPSKHGRRWSGDCRSA